MSSKLAKFEQAAAYLKTLSHPQRLAILKLLGQEEQLRVTDIYQRLEMGQAIVSQHLIRMKKDGVLTSKQTGTTIHYALRLPQLLEVIKCIEAQLETQ